MDALRELLLERGFLLRLEKGESSLFETRGSQPLRVWLDEGSRNRARIETFDPDNGTWHETERLGPPWPSVPRLTRALAFARKRQGGFTPNSDPSF